MFALFWQQTGARTATFKFFQTTKFLLQSALRSYSPSFVHDESLPGKPVFREPCRFQTKTLIANVKSHFYRLR